MDKIFYRALERYTFRYWLYLTLIGKRFIKIIIMTIYCCIIKDHICTRELLRFEAIRISVDVDRTVPGKIII